VPAVEDDHGDGGRAVGEPGGRGHQVEAPTLGHGIAGIHGEVLKRRFQRSRIGAARRAGLADVDADLDPVVQRAAQHRRQGGQQRQELHVGRFPGLPARAREQVFGEPLAAVDERAQRGARDDGVRVGAAFAPGGCVEELARRLQEPAEHGGGIRPVEERIRLVRSRCQARLSVRTSRVAGGP
jgi:hypothetical protein